MSYQLPKLEITIKEPLNDDHFLVETNLPGYYYVVDRDTLGALHTQIDLKFNELHQRKNNSKKVQNTVDIG